MVAQIREFNYIYLGRSMSLQSESGSEDRSMAMGTPYSCRTGQLLGGACARSGA